MVTTPYNQTALGELRLEPRRPVKLDDREWLKRRYRLIGDRAIAKELGCARSTVSRARIRLGIPSEHVGPRRGVTTSSTRDFATAPAKGELILTGSLAALAQRFSEDQRHRVPPSREVLIASCKGWLDAERNHDQLGTEDALLSIASAALLIHDHQVKLRKAA